MTTFHLYFDESGNFNIDDEYTRYADSQLAGILVYASNDQSSPEIMDSLAQEILNNSYQQSYGNQKRTYHGNELRPSPQYNKFINNIIDIISNNNQIKKNWQGIRLVNKEEIGYGTQDDNYLYMVAELAIRIVKQKKNEGFKDIKLNIYPAERSRDTQDYKNVFTSLFGILKAREFDLNCTINNITPISASDHYLLQLADLLSNASYRNYNKCNKSDKNTAENLQNFFGDYNFSLAIPLFEERIESLLKEEVYGLAIRFILLEINSGNNQDKAQEFLEQTIDKLAQLPSAERNAHLNYLTNWLEQEINQKRDSENGYKLANKINKYIYANLEKKLSEKNELKSIIWFKYNLHFWALTACNHSGRLFRASEEAETLDQLKSKLYQQVEHLSLLMEGLIAQAVHYTDCFEFDKAINNTQFVIDFYDYFFGEEMQEFFSDLLQNNDDSQSIKSDLRAKGFGTCLQAQTYKYLQNNDLELLNKARENSERAINEFVALNDKKRQYQYRSQLETAGGNFKASRQYLAQSLDLDEDSSYLDIMKHIRQSEINDQAFPLLHLCRLGYGCYFHSNHTEWQTFQEALQQSRLLINPWFVTNPPEYYPIHGILRRVASFGLIMGNTDLAEQALGKLNNLKPIAKSPIFGLIQIATYLEYAGLTWSGELSNDFNNLIAHKDRQKVTITYLTDKLNDQNFEQMQVFKTQVIDTVKAIQEDNGQIHDVKRTLLKLANQIGY
ncbi:DUF3800 domain-containing protein [Cyanobacterium stanieri LEGE 03274]|uniref:DUF3800 domain-containing protein n=1 Tax=Cyanobacterium stanieri LEGE 03274 TaxID=1828756 RepID=A0ABR9V3Z9_9CHRO|nr:DUF3800 domain-containing protein [Cyanobacterium stanieri]MBE9222629.1 DUF3800 domain-containing protein [Cyanobacterium stanieri LEGE 03274]